MAGVSVMSARYCGSLPQLGGGVSADRLDVHHHGALAIGLRVPGVWFLSLSPGPRQNSEFA
jgi:hypothetical protein